MGAPATFLPTAIGAPTAPTASLATVVLTPSPPCPATHRPPEPSCLRADCYVGGLDYEAAYIEGSTSSLAVTVTDVRFGLPGRWAPEVNAWLILSHAPGRIVTVKSRVAVVDMTPAVARTVNSFNVSLLEDAGERLDLSEPARFE